MNGDVSIDVGNAVPYLIEYIKSWFGKDNFTTEAKDRFEKLFKLSVKYASHIQIIGMWEPIPIEQIYQPTRLTGYAHLSHGKEIYSIFDLIDKKENAIILAGPGDGKTTLIHWTFIQLLLKRSYLPILITLRWPDALSELEALIKDLHYGKKPSKSASIILLVDGYDEIDLDQRKKLSKLLSEFSSYNFGNYYLTCRTHYTIFELKEKYYWIDKFNHNDSFGFCKSFLKIYGCDISPSILLKELQRRGFQSFVEHPLMLALVCFLQSTPPKKDGLPRTPVGLIRRAIDTLTFRWDESKGVSRPSAIPLDGEERIRCLMKIAYEMEDLISPNHKVYKSTKNFLINQQIEGVDSQQFLLELAQWYGILVPVSPDEWGFVHRTIHDFLAARYWVECGAFASGGSFCSVRSAYAMSLLSDATTFLKMALEQKCEMYVFSQCLINNASFDTDIIADAILNYFHKIITIGAGYFIPPTGLAYSHINQELDFFQDDSIPFLYSLLQLAINESPDQRLSIIFITYVLFEFLNRNIIIKEKMLNRISKYFQHKNVNFRIGKGNEIITFSLDNVLKEII